MPTEAAASPDEGNRSRGAKTCVVYLDLPSPAAVLLWSPGAARTAVPQAAVLPGVSSDTARTPPPQGDHLLATGIATLQTVGITLPGN